MKEKCLLIITKDRRKFLTHQKNLPSLIEFTKTFGAEVYTVQAEGQKILELKALANAICNQEYDDDPECTKLKKIYPQPLRERKTVIKEAGRIRKFIRDRLLSGKTVSLKELKTKYENRGLTDACLCNHFSTIRKELTREGKQIEKISGGKYRLL